MKSRLVAALCASAVVLSACGSDETSSAASPSTTVEARTTLADTPTPTTDTAATTEVPTTDAPATTEQAVATTDASTTTFAGVTPGGPTAIVPGADADVDAVARAYLVVFDSTTPYADKEPYLQDAAALKATVGNYESAASAVGGIALVPTVVTISGDTAAVIYDVHFAGTAVYNGLDGDAINLGGTWQVPRAKFCEFMAQAQNPCPA